MSIRSHLIAACAPAVAALFATASPASAFEPPELFVRTSDTDAVPAPGEWIPLASAPRVDWMGGWEIGYRIQSPELHAAALSVSSVPDGVPHQGRSAGYCGDVAGNVGEIQPIGDPVVYEGNGTYSVTVTLGSARRSGPGDCSGPSSTGSFSTSIAVTPAVFGTPLSVREPQPAHGTAGDDPGVPPGETPGVRAPHPPGGRAQVQCALDAAVQPDGSLRGRALTLDHPTNHETEVPEWEFRPPGEWTCVARGLAAADGGTALNEGDETSDNASSWSPPLPLTVKADFRPAPPYVSGRRGKHFMFKYTAQFPSAAVGGTGTVRIERVVRCRRGQLTLKRVSTSRGKFDAKGHVKIRVPKPKVDGEYVVRFGLAGAPYYRDIAVTRGSIWFKKNSNRYPILDHPTIC